MLRSFLVLGFRVKALGIRVEGVLVHKPRGSQSRPSTGKSKPYLLGSGFRGLGVYFFGGFRGLGV